MAVSLKWFEFRAKNATAHLLPYLMIRSKSATIANKHARLLGCKDWIKIGHRAETVVVAGCNLPADAKEGIYWLTQNRVLACKVQL